MKLLVDDPIVLSRVFHLAMDAATQAEAWGSLCDEIAEAHDAAAFMVFAYDLQSHKSPLFLGSRAVWEEAAEMRSRVERGEVEEDKAGYETVMRASPGAVLSEPEFFGLARGETPPPNAYRDAVLRAVGASARFGMKLNAIGPFLDVAIYHSRDGGESRHDALQAEARLLQPLLSKTLETTRILAALTRTYALLLELFDRLDFAVAFCDGTGRVLNANRRFTDMAAERDGLIVNQGAIAAPRPGATRAIRACIAAALDGGANEGALATVLPRRSGRGPLFLRTSPVSDPARDGPGAVALVLLLDPEDESRVSAEGLAAFGVLSPAELEVCRHLVRGLGTDEVAQVRDTSVETARGQVKSIRAKLGLGSRLDLLRLAVSTTPPVDVGGGHPPDGG